MLDFSAVYFIISILADMTGCNTECTPSYMYRDAGNVLSIIHYSLLSNHIYVGVAFSLQRCNSWPF